MKTIKKKNISLKKKYHPCSVYYTVIEMSHEPVHELRICVRSWAPSCLLVLYSSLFLTWVKALRNGPSKICGRQPLKNLK